MKISTREDIEAPIDYVFWEVSDFDGIERQILRRGVRLERVSTGGEDKLGMSWTARVPFRGRQRDVSAHVAELTAPTFYRISSTTGGVLADVAVELVALSRNRTRVVIGIDIRPASLSARLLIQSMKLAKSNLQRRFDQRVAEYALAITERYART